MLEQSVPHLEWIMQCLSLLRHFVSFTSVCFLFVILSGNLNKPWIHCPILFNVSWQYCSRIVENGTSFEKGTHGSVFTRNQEHDLLLVLHLLVDCKSKNSVPQLSKFYSMLCLCRNTWYWSLPGVAIKLMFLT